jgi:hypothetical protein
LLRNGRVLVAGGYNGGCLTSAELYDPVTRTFTLTGAMRFATSQVYDPTSGTWRRGKDLPGERATQVAVPLADGSVLVAGGERWIPAHGSISSTLRYTP